MSGIVKGMIISNMETKARTDKNYEFKFEEVYKICKQQFKECNYNYPYHEKEIVQMLTSYNIFDIYPDQKKLVVRKQYPTIKDYKTLLQFLKQRDFEGVALSERLYQSYEGIKKDIEDMIEQKKVRHVIINNNRFIYSMVIDINYNLISENPTMFNKKEYLKMCKEEGANKIIRKDNNQLERFKKVKDTRYNEWVDGYAELKRKYEEELVEKRINNRKNN